MYGVYNPDGTKRTEWPRKSSAVAAAKEIGIVGLYVVNERNAEIVYTVKRGKPA